jgi:hypothetical protein
MNVCRPQRVLHEHVHLHFHIACAAGPLPLSAPVSCAWDEVSSSIRSSMHGLSESVSLRDRVYPSSFVGPRSPLVSFTFSTMQSPIGNLTDPLQYYMFSGDDS